MCYGDNTGVCQIPPLVSAVLATLPPVGEWGVPPRREGGVSVLLDLPPAVLWGHGTLPATTVTQEESQRGPPSRKRQSRSSGPTLKGGKKKINRGKIVSKLNVFHYFQCGVCSAARCFPLGGFRKAVNRMNCF